MEVVEFEYAAFGNRSLLQDKNYYKETKISGCFSLVFRCFVFFPMEIYPTGGKEKCSICLEHGRLLIFPYFPSYQKFIEAVTITAYNCSPENKKCNNNQQAELEPF